MSKLSDTLKQALEKKQGTHPVQSDGSPAVEKKIDRTGAGPARKPVTRQAGRGR